MMEYVDVISDAIAGLGYDKDQGTMDVQFSNGQTYRFSGVPEWRFREMANAPSVGGYFYRVVRNAYPSRRVGGSL